jgi:hypothetical protein
MHPGTLTARTQLGDIGKRHLKAEGPDFPQVTRAHACGL